MNKNFQFIEYSQIPKKNLNAQIENLNPKKGLWIKKESTTNIPNFKSASLKLISKLLYTYFDYMHWPELGDTGMDFLKGLQKETLFIEDFLFTKLEKEESLFSNISTAKSNYVITDLSSNLGLQLDQLKELGFETLKFKVGKKFEEELKILLTNNLSDFEVRLDFNSSLEFKTVKDSYSYLKKLPNLEYCEDPCLFEENKWKELNELFPVAFDYPKSHQSYSESFTRAIHFIKHFIIKPTRQLNHLELEKLVLKQKKITLTNAMDSSLGTWKCFIYFSILQKLYPKSFSVPGLHTHHLYQQTFGSEYLFFKGAYWNATLANLDQFLEFLDKQSWKSL